MVNIIMENLVYVSQGQNNTRIEASIPSICSQMLRIQMMYRTLNYAPNYFFIASISV